MPQRNVQYKVSKEHLYYLYRYLVLPWELEWKTSDFNTNLGKLKKYEKSRGILLKSVRNISGLEIEAESYKNRTKYQESSGVMLFLRGSSNKPKEVLRQLRNISAHGNFRLRQVNKVKCLGFEHHSDTDKKLRVTGHLPFDELKPLIAAIMTTRVSS